MPISRQHSIFRLRFVLHVLIFAAGLFAPWDRIFPGTSNLSTWLVLAAEVGRQGWMSFTGVTVAVLVLATVLALGAAMLRTWAAAWIGYGVVGSGQMQAGELVAEGPYRRVRHPLYVGLLLHTLALAVLMQPAGAIFAVVATALLDGWLMVSEDRYLRDKLGAVYEAYRREVPAIVPRLTPAARGGPSVGRRPSWGVAALSEIYFWGVAVSFAAAGWRYNAFLIERCVLISFGAALVARALLPKQTPTA